MFSASKFVHVRTVRTRLSFFLAAPTPIFPMKPRRKPGDEASSGEKNDVWNGVHGKHGVGRMNASGEALLSWCALNGLVVLNTSCFLRRSAFISTHGSILVVSSGIV